MPVYEYQCSSCQLKFELLRPLQQANEAASCPQCHNGARRLVSTFASFSKDASGQVNRVAGSGPSCGPCTSSSCSTCGV